LNRIGSCFKPTDTVPGPMRHRPPPLLSKRHLRATRPGAATPGSCRRPIPPPHLSTCAANPDPPPQWLSSSCPLQKGTECPPVPPFPLVLPSPPFEACTPLRPLSFSLLSTCDPGEPTPRQSCPRTSLLTTES
jgi:hypothetical protein